MTDRLPLLLLTAVLTLSCCSLATAFQAREHLTEHEIELVKDAQILDKRVDVFIKAADRRMLVLSGMNPDAATAKQLKKDSDAWGELPNGSRAELIADIAGIASKMVTGCSHDSNCAARMRYMKTKAIPSASMKYTPARDGRSRSRRCTVLVCSRMSSTS